MSVINVQIPVTLQVVGVVDSDGTLASLGAAVEQAVLGRIAAATHQLGLLDVGRQAHVVDEPSERFDDQRANLNASSYAVASYDKGGQLSVVAMRTTTEPPARPEIDELDYAFFFASDRHFGVPARKFLTKYYPKHRHVSLHSIEELFDRIWSDIRQMRRGHKAHVREIVIAAHANVWGEMQVAITRADAALPPKVRPIFSAKRMVELQEKFREGSGSFKQFRERRHTVVTSVIDEDTTIVVRGCNFGGEPQEGPSEGLEKLRALFGGQPRVWAPTAYQGYEILKIGGSMLPTKLFAFNWLIEQGYLPVEMLPAPDEDKEEFIRRTFPDGTIPGEFLSEGPALKIGEGMLPDELAAFDWLVEQKYLPKEMSKLSAGDKLRFISRTFPNKTIGGKFLTQDVEAFKELEKKDLWPSARLKNLIQKHLGRTKQAEAEKVRDPSVTPSFGRYWAISEPSLLGLDPELDELTMAQLEDWGRRLMNPYLPQNAAMLQRLRSAWERQSVEQFSATGLLPGDPNDPLTGLPPESSFGDSNLIAGDASRYPGQKSIDIFESETQKVIEPVPPSAHPTFDEMPVTSDLPEGASVTAPGPPEDATPTPPAPTIPNAPPTGAPPRGWAQQRPALPPQLRVRRGATWGGFGKEVPSEVLSEPETSQPPALPILDPVIAAILGRKPQDSGHFWDVLDLGMSIYGAAKLVPAIETAVEYTLVGLSIDIVALVEPLVAMIGLGVTISDATDAQVVGAQRLGVRLGLEGAILLAGGTRGHLSPDQVQAQVRNDRALLAQITYSYPLSVDDLMANFRIGIEAATSAANKVLDWVDKDLNHRLDAQHLSAEDRKRAFDQGIGPARVAGIGVLYRAAFR